MRLSPGAIHVRQNKFIKLASRGAIFGLQFKTVVTVVSYFGSVIAPLFFFSLEIYALMIQNKRT